jgi:hypothetical protein
MFGFIRRKLREKWRNLTYSEVLNSILIDEEELIKEWYQRFIKSTSDSIPNHGPGQIGPFWSENLEFRAIWGALCRLETESRKIEEIKRLSEQEENNLSEKDKRTLKQLKRKLEWKPLQLKRGEEQYLSAFERNFIARDTILKSGYEKEFKEKQYKRYIKEIVCDEVKFWEHLVMEEEKISKIVKRNKKISEEMKKKVNAIIKQIDSDDPAYWQNYLSLIGKGADESENKDYWQNQAVKDRKKSLLIIQNEGIENYLEFFNRVDQILKDIKKKLKLTKPC